MHREWIATTLCENKYDPASDCQGHCYLEKELKKDMPVSGDNQSSGRRQAGVWTLSPHLLSPAAASISDCIALCSVWPVEFVEASYEFVPLVYCPPKMMCAV